MAIGERIRQARGVAHLTQEALAEKVGVTPQAISKYERQQDVPSSGVLLRIASALERPLTFFLRPVRVGSVSPQFRARNLPQYQRERVLADIQDWLERYLEIEELLDLDGFSTWLLPNGFPLLVDSLEAIESAADELRRAWDLGSGPISNLTELLEERGIKIGFVDAEERFDACTFSFQVDGTGREARVIAVRTGLPGDRQRFDIAHELGHIAVLPQAGLDSEKAAHRFAAAFLVPAATARRELGAHRHELNLRELHILKHQFGMSISSWAYRAQDLGIVSPLVASSVWRRLNARGARQVEPGTPYPAEQPLRFERLVYHALAEEIITKSRAAELLGRPVLDLENDFAGADGEALKGLRRGF